MGAATDVTLDEIQDADVFDLLAVCCLMAQRGQLKACGEERQGYSVFVDGQKSGAQWNEAVSPFHAKQVRKSVEGMHCLGRRFNLLQMPSQAGP